MLMSFYVFIIYFSFRDTLSASRCSAPLPDAKPQFLLACAVKTVGRAKIACDG